MQRQPLAASQRERIAAGLPFVESLARRVAASMPHSIELGDLVQDGMIGLIDAACRFDEDRGIKFETFAERRVRGAMIDALRRDAWPRGVRRQRRRARSRPRAAAARARRRAVARRPGRARRLGRGAARPHHRPHQHHRIDVAAVGRRERRRRDRCLPRSCRPSRRRRTRRYEEQEVRDRIRAAIASLPPRERRVVALYYYAEATMKQIGAEIGVNESRVSQLHARAVQRLRKALGADCSARKRPRLSVPPSWRFSRRCGGCGWRRPIGQKTPAVVLPYKAPTRVENRARVRSSEPRVAAARD